MELLIIIPLAFFKTILSKCPSNFSRASLTADQKLLQLYKTNNSPSWKESVDLIPNLYGPMNFVCKRRRKNFPFEKLVGPCQQPVNGDDLFFSLKNSFYFIAHMLMFQDSFLMELPKMVSECTWLSTGPVSTIFVVILCKISVDYSTSYIRTRTTKNMFFFLFILAESSKTFSSSSKRFYFRISVRKKCLTEKQREKWMECSGCMGNCGVRQRNVTCCCCFLRSLCGTIDP